MAIYVYDDEAHLCNYDDDVRLKISGCAAMKFRLDKSYQKSSTSGDTIVAHSNNTVDQTVISMMSGFPKAKIVEAILVLKSDARDDHLPRLRNILASNADDCTPIIMYSKASITEEHEIQMAGGKDTIEKNNTAFFNAPAIIVPLWFQSALSSALKGNHQSARAHLSYKCWSAYLESIRKTSASRSEAGEAFVRKWVKDHAPPPSCIIQ